MHYTQIDTAIKQFSSQK